MLPDASIKAVVVGVGQSLFRRNIANPRKGARIIVSSSCTELLSACLQRRHVSLPEQFPQDGNHFGVAVTLAASDTVAFCRRAISSERQFLKLS